MASEDVQTNLRLPADLKDRLQSSAAENNRSLSAEAASRLEASYSSDIPSSVVSSIAGLAEALESEKIKVLIEQALAYRLALALKSVFDTGQLPSNFHVRTDPNVRSLVETVDEALRDYEGSLKAARAKIDAQAKRLNIALDNLPKQIP